MSAAPTVIDDAEVSRIIAQYVTHSPVGLTFSDDIPLEAWGKAHDFYASLHEKTNWLLGDSINFASKKFGEKYTQWIHVSGKEYNTLTNIVAVCERIEIPRRRGNLPFSFHAEVAYIHHTDADRILKEADSKNWSRNDVRDAVAKVQGRPTAAEKAAAKVATPPSQRTTTTAPPAPAQSIDVAATVTTSLPVQVPAAPESKPLVAVNPLGSTPILLPERAEDILTVAEARLHQFNEVAVKIDVSAMSVLQAKRFLKLLTPSDELIDKLQNRIAA